ncbi:MAG: hypothetical protein ACOC3I_10660 [Verrucomicrobiota bacterium]
MSTSTSDSALALEWENVRERFKHSMMIRTEIHKLAQNLDLSWPLKGREETPLKYVSYTHEELLLMPGLAESPDRIRLLVDILTETMAFDDPFGEMAEQVDSSSKRDDGSQRALAKLGVPLTFPLQLCALSEETRNFCEAEEIRTLGQFLDFAQNMAQHVVVGGDFRAFLNAVAHPEEKSIARYLPFRPGHEGLHLPEGVAQALGRFDASTRLFFHESAGAPTTVEDRRDTRPLGEKERANARAAAREHLERLFAWFEGSRTDLADAAAEGPAQLARRFAVLEDEQVEKTCVWLTLLALDLENTHQPQRKSLFARLFGR